VRDDLFGDITTAEAFDAAFAGRACHFVDHVGGLRPMAMERWAEAPDQADDEIFLARSSGRTLDVGCGPGRLAAELRARDVPALGIDVSGEAVRMARRRGAHVLRRDVFSRLPHEGLWNCVLLADGNIGIGGDPVTLLRRVCGLLRPGGTAIVEVAHEEAGLRRERWRLRVDGRTTPPFAWAVVGADAIAAIAHEAGLALSEMTSVGRRQAAVLVSPAA